jgi:hypothetical protein
MVDILKIFTITLYFWKSSRCPRWKNLHDRTCYAVLKVTYCCSMYRALLSDIPKASNIITTNYLLV